MRKPAAEEKTPMWVFQISIKLAVEAESADEVFARFGLPKFEGRRNLEFFPGRNGSAAEWRYSVSTDCDEAAPVFDALGRLLRSSKLQDSEAWSEGERGWIVLAVTSPERVQTVELQPEWIQMIARSGLSLIVQTYQFRE